MKKETIATGRTVEAALSTACEQLDVLREDAQFEILDLPRRGFLGLSHTPARIKAWVEIPDVVPAPIPRPSPRVAPPSPSPSQENVTSPSLQPRHETACTQLAQPPTVANVPIAQPVQTATLAQVTPCAKALAAADFITAVIHAMNLSEVTVEVTQNDQNVLILLSGDVSGVAIGRRGETLDALQYLAGLAANRVAGDYIRVVLDSGNYREKRRHTLEQLAQKLASSCAKTGRSITLEPMNPYERRIIHATVSEIEGVTSTSLGEEPNRCVVISSTMPRPTGGVSHGSGGEMRPRGESRPYGAPGKPPAASPPRPQGEERRSLPQRDRPMIRRENGSSGDGCQGGRADDHHSPRREKPEPYQETSRRESAPTEAANQPLYGKIEL